METVSELNIQAIDYGRPFVTEESFNFNPVVFNNCPDGISAKLAAIIRSFFFIFLKEFVFLLFICSHVSFLIP